jgi:hypothetical protein
MAYRVVAAPAIATAFWYGELDPVISETVEIRMFVLADDAEALRRIDQVEIGTARVEVDWAAGLLRFSAHCDPVVPVEYDGSVGFEMTLYAVEQAEAAHWQAHLLVDGQREPVGMDFDDRSVERPFSSLVMPMPGNNWMLNVSSEEPVEVIWQRVCYGQFREYREFFDAGVHSIPVPPAFADYYGVCVSSRQEIGGYEQKHVLFGHLGLATGRWFMDAAQGVAYEPKSEFRFGYRAMLLLARSAEEIEAVRWILEGRDENGVHHPFHEIEVIVPVDGDVDGCRAACVPLSLTMNYRLTTFGPTTGADILVLGDGLASAFGAMAVASPLLFADTYADGFYNLLLETASRPDLERLWDRAWFTAYRGVQDRYDGPLCGIAFSYPHDAAVLDRRLLLRARKDEFWRKNATGSPCYECSEASACANALSFPFVQTKCYPLFVKEGVCQLRHLISGDAP